MQSDGGGGGCGGGCGGHDKAWGKTGLAPAPPAPPASPHRPPCITGLPRSTYGAGSSLIPWSVLACAYMGCLVPDGNLAASLAPCAGRGVLVGGGGGGGGAGEAGGEGGPLQPPMRRSSVNTVLSCTCCCTEYIPPSCRGPPRKRRSLHFKRHSLLYCNL